MTFNTVPALTIPSAGIAGMTVTLPLGEGASLTLNASCAIALEPTHKAAIKDRVLISFIRLKRFY
jgi:hypothetical protein